MLKCQLYIFLLNFLLLMNHKTVLASSPDDYFGQAEAEYDYYEDEYFVAYGDVGSPEVSSMHKGLVIEDLKYLKDATPKEHIIIASKYIGEIDARGSTITIHDSDRRDPNHDRNKNLNSPTKDHVEDFDSEISTDSIEIEEDVESEEEEIESEEEIINEEEVKIDEDIEGAEEFKSEEEIEIEEGIESEENIESEEDIESEEHIESEKENKPEEKTLIAESLVSVDDEKGNMLPPITIKNFGSEDTFVDKLQGLQMGMDAMVTILKEIAGKVGCPLARIEKLQADISHCPTPFTKVDSGDCLYLDLEKRLSWTAARSACTKLGADLVYPLTQGQGLGFVMALNQHIDIPRSPVWVGGSDRQHEGVWHWVDGGVTPSNLAWLPGQPRHISGREDCMALSFVEPQGLKASNCLIRKHYICQKKI